MKRKHIRIAVMGAKQAGKTVFLTAIDDLLRYLDKSQSPLGEWSVKDYGVLDGEIDSFPVSKYRECYSKDPPEWPPSTTKPAMLCCSLTLSKSRSEDFLGRTLKFCGLGDRIEEQLTVEFLDMPGERMTDIATMRDSSFQEWSKTVCWIGRNRNVLEQRSQFDEYVKSVEEIVKKGGDEKGTRILEAYKKVVAAYMKASSPFITPSDMQLDEDGKAPEYDDDEKALAGRLNDVGFAPLPQKLFDGKHADLVSSFEKKYDDYRKKKERLFKWLSKVDQIYFLVDVLGILEHGNGRYEGVKNQIDFAFPKEDSWLKWFWKGVCGRNLSRICMVATQVDRTNIDRDKENVEKLLGRLFKSVNHCSRGVEKETMLCAAVRSTSDCGKDKIKGKFEFGEGENKVVKSGDEPVLEVPSEFDFRKQEQFGPWPKPVPRFRADDSEETRSYQLREILERMLCLR